MFQGKWRLWNISISILVFLTAYNIFLTIKLLYSSVCEAEKSPEILVETVQIEQPDCKENKNERQEFGLPLFNKTIHEKDEIYNALQIKEKQLLNLNLALGRSDDRLTHKLFDNVIIGDKFIHLTDSYKTCLATQSSLDKMASLIESSLHWSGPISLAAFAGCQKELNRLLLYILYLRKCNSRIRDKVTFHIAIVKDKELNSYEIDQDRLDKMECGNPVGVLKELLKEFIKRGVNSWRFKVPYPQNLLRNLARKNCHSKYVFLTDVDILPSKGMAENLNVFLDHHKCDGKCAYVVPTYELDERVHFPPNKTDLIRMANKGLARPFHHKVFIYNQYATNFSRWQNFKDPTDKIRISHPVTNFEFLYEPFYIATDNVPPHDERFIGYGYTRNSQVYEMFVSGYEFLVLSPIFTCHWGLQVKKTRPPWREHQNNLNRKQFDRFKKEIFARYNKDPLNMIKH